MLDAIKHITDVKFFSRR